MTERICVFGSSTAYGCGDDAGGWVARLRAQLAGERADAEVYNLSVLGDDTYDGLLRLAPELSARNGTVAVIHLGLNDSQLSHEYGGRPKVSLAAFEGNLALLLRRATRLAPHVLFIDLHEVDERRTTPCAWDRDRSFRTDVVRRYRQQARDVCRRYGVAQVDPAEFLHPAALADGIHPGPDGHRRLAEAVRAALARLVPGLGRQPEADCEWTRADDFTAEWDDRVALMARYVDRPGLVADIGCGRMQLRSLLRRDNDYLPVDRVARDEETLVVDLNRAPFPRTGAAVVVMSGILEYIDDVPRLLAQLFADEATTRVILSYSSTDLLPDRRDRCAPTASATPWRSHLGVKEILAVVRRCGFTVAHVDYTTNNFIFVVDRLVIEARAGAHAAGEPG